MGEYDEFEIAPDKTTGEILRSWNIPEDKIDAIKKLIGKKFGEYTEVALLDPENVKELITRGADDDVEVKRKKVLGVSEKISIIDKRHMFNLFVQGVRAEDIAKIYGLRSTKTVYNYIHKFAPNHKLGRSGKYDIMSDSDRELFKEMYENGENSSVICKIFNMSTNTVYITGKRLGLVRGKKKKEKKENLDNSNNKIECGDICGSELRDSEESASFGGDSREENDATVGKGEPACWMNPSELLKG